MTLLLWTLFDHWCLHISSVHDQFWIAILERIYKTSVVYKALGVKLSWQWSLLDPALTVKKKTMKFENLEQPRGLDLNIPNSHETWFCWKKCYYEFWPFDWEVPEKLGQLKPITGCEFLIKSDTTIAWFTFVLFRTRSEFDKNNELPIFLQNRYSLRELPCAPERSTTNLGT